MMDLQNKTLTCKECGRLFLFTVRDQRFYAEKGFTNAPGRCPECRAARRASYQGWYERCKPMDRMLRYKQLTTMAAGELPSRDSSALHGPGTNVLLEVAEISYRCEALAAEKARLERENASLLEKVGLLASERNYLKNALAAASNSTVLAPEKTDVLASMPWWKRMMSGWRGGTV